MTEEDFDDSVVTCRECAFWIKTVVKEPVINAPEYGTCFCNPPSTFPAQQPNALGHLQMGFINARPILPSNERACGAFELKDEPESTLDS